VLIQILDSSKLCVNGKYDTLLLRKASRWLSTATRYLSLETKNRLLSGNNHVLISRAQ